MAYSSWPCWHMAASITPINAPLLKSYSQLFSVSIPRRRSSLQTQSAIHRCVLSVFFRLISILLSSLVIFDPSLSRRRVVVWIPAYILLLLLREFYVWLIDRIVFPDLLFIYNMYSSARLFWDHCWNYAYILYVSFRIKYKINLFLMYTNTYTIQYNING